MATSPNFQPENRPDFRAPPPSPIASGCRSSVVNDEVLSEFLEHSLRVPDLILPDRVFPRQVMTASPPEIDFRSLETDSVSKILESVVEIGCFQLVNHGISLDFITSVLSSATGVFRLSPEKKAIARSGDKWYGFDDLSCGDEIEMNEEFVWCRDQDLKSVMEEIWPQGYSNFSLKMERLSSEIERVAEKFVQILLELDLQKCTKGSYMKERQDLGGSTCCCLYKHCQINPSDSGINSLKYDIIRMLIRGPDYSHALCLHICNGSSDFHIYSKKGWISFQPNKDALILTVGDQMQAWSGGKYKNVIGRPILPAQDEDISMAFLCSPPIITKSFQGKADKTISLKQQVILPIMFILVYHFIAYICRKF